MVFGLSLVLMGLGAGCGTLQTAVDVPGQTIRAITPGKKGKPPIDPVEIQQTLLRFADEYLTQMAVGTDRLRRGTNAPDRAEILRWKTSLGSQICSIASGPNAVADMLDMTIFVTVTRMSLESHWKPNVFGDSAQPILDNCRHSETEIWRLAATVLTPEQQAELRKAIEAWHRDNPLPESVMAARSLGFSSRIAEQHKEDTAKPDSVFSLLKLDPLSGMDPAVREIAQSRLFAERALYVTQKMPTLLRWQTELLSIEALDVPVVTQMVTNTTQITAAVERFAAVAEKLPGQLSTEREEILKALDSQESKLTPLVNEVRQTLMAGTGLSSSLNTTLATLDVVMKRVGVGDTNKPAGPPNTNAEPFRIQDYTQSAAQLEGTARQLTELLLTLDRTIGSTNLLQLSTQVGPAVQQAQLSGKEVVDYAFRKGILLVAVILIAALAYRFITFRPTTAKKLNPPS